MTDTDHPGLSEQRARGLTPEQVAEIRDARAKATSREWGAARYARKFGVNRTTVERAARGASWSAFAQPPASVVDRSSKPVPFEGHDEQNQRETAADLVARLSEMLGDDTDFDNYTFSIKRGNLRRLLKALTGSGRTNHAAQ
jgi:hypothetical protein